MSAETEREHVGQTQACQEGIVGIFWARLSRGWVPGRPLPARHLEVVFNPHITTASPTLCLFQSGFEVAKDFGGIRFTDVSYQI